MRLGDLITAETKINEEILIGRELELLEGEMLLLAIQKGEFFVESEEAVVPATRILALYDALDDEDEDEDADWEAEEAWDDEQEFQEYDEIMTNRQAILNEKDEFEPEVLDVEEIIINGREYQIYEAEESFMDEHPHDAVQALKRADEAGFVSEKWEDKNLDDLTLVEYIVEESMMEVAWRADILHIDVNFSEEGGDDSEVLCGKVFECPLGRMDVPVTFSIKAPSGKDVEVKIFGTYALDIWQDADMLGLDEEELEEICEKDERILVVEYSVSEDAVLNFYTKDFLDAEYTDPDERTELMLGMEEHELQMIDIVPDDFNEHVVLELLSYEVFED